MARLGVEIYGDAAGLKAALGESIAATNTWRDETNAATKDVRLAFAGVTDAELRATVAADKLAIATARYGDGTLGAAKAALAYRREMDALSASTTRTGVGFGATLKSLGGLAAGFGAYLSIKGSVEAAEARVKAEQALATAITRIGGNADAELPAIRKWAAEQARFGVSANDALTGLGRLVELTGSTRKAMEAYTAALAISKATGKQFNAVSLAVGKALNGQTTALARYIGRIPKGTTANELLARVMQKYGGQAQANTVATDRLRAEVTNLETTIGEALLPTIDGVANSMADWLAKNENQRRIQRDVNKVMKTAEGVAHGLGDAFRDVKPLIDDVNSAFGGTEHTVRLLVLAFAGLKIAGLVGGFATIGKSVAGVGSSAAIAEAKVSTLRASLLGLSGLTLAAITIPIAVEITRGAQALSKYLGSTDIGKKLGIGDTPLPKGISFDEVAKLKTDLDANKLTKRDRVVYHALTGRNAPTSTDVTSGVGEHGALAENTARRAKQQADAAAKGKTTTPTTPAYTPSRVEQLNLALAKNPNDVGTITAKLTYDREAAAFAEKRLNSGKLGQKQGEALAEQLKAVYGDINSLTSQLAQIDAAAKKKESAHNAAMKKLADQYSTPLNVQLAQAKAAATAGTADDLATAKEAKTAAEKALASGKLGMQGQIDAWNVIADANQQLEQAVVQKGMAVKVSAKAFVAGLSGLSRAQKIALEQHYAEVSGLGGHLPSGTGVLGQNVTINIHGDPNPEKTAQTVLRHLQKHAKRGTARTRGPHAGSYLGLQ